MKISYFLFLALLSSVPIIGQPQKIGLDTQRINTITIAENSYYEKIIVAGTENNGMYFHQTTDPDTTWMNVFFKGRTISYLYAQELDANNTKLFMAPLPDSSLQYPLIYSNVMPVQSAIPAEDSGLDRSKINIIKSIAGFNYLPGGNQMPVFCCTNDPNIYKYSNRAWSKAWEGSEIVSFNFVYTADSSVWAGGIFNGFIATPLLLKSTDYGTTWDTLQIPIGEVYSCYSLCVCPINNNVVFLGLNENIMKSTDGGKTWSASLSDIHNVVFTGISINPKNPAQVFAGGKNGDSPFVLFESIDGGVNWRRVEVPVNCKCILKGINTMGGTIINDKYVVFIGTDGDGIWVYSPSVSSVTKEQFRTGDFHLFQNYPNPFNPSTKIKYQLSRSGNITLTVTDILGREVKILVNEHQFAGLHEVDFNASDLAGGIYFYKITSGKFSVVKKMILLR